MDILKIKNLTKSYEKVNNVLNDLNFEVKKGEFVAILGPSGCGKSTLLNVIAGLEEFDAGHITFNEENIEKLPPKDRDIAMVFQSYALYPMMTVEENLATPLKLRNLPKVEIAKKVYETAEILKISDLLKKKPRELSGGQRQRVSLGRAMIRNPKIYLMDEPLSNLDAKLRSLMRKEIVKMHQLNGGITLYVTHEQVEAMTMADKIIVMFDGKIQQIGNPEDIYKKPATLEVAKIVGAPQINIIDKENNHFDNISKENYKYFTIRPENIKISKNIERNMYFVDYIENIGSEKIIYLKNTVNEFVVKLDANLNFSIGDQVSIKFEESKINYYTEDGLLIYV